MPRPALLLVAYLTACGPQVVDLQPAAWSQVLVADPADAVVVDTRSAEAFEAGHIPGAVSVRWPELVGPGEDGLWGPLPREELAAVLGDRGLQEDDPIVLVGGGPLGFGEDGNVYWVLRWLGHDDVRVLNGGHVGWLAGGGDIEEGAAETPRTTYVPGADDSVLATANDVADREGVLLDVRSAEEHTQGHIPGATWFEWTDVFDVESVADEATVRARLAEVGVGPDTPAVTYCTSGVRAGHTFMILDALGVPNARNFVGSWRAWTAEDRPVER